MCWRRGAGEASLADPVGPNIAQVYFFVQTPVTFAPRLQQLPQVFGRRHRQHLCEAGGRRGVWVPGGSRVAAAAAAASESTCKVAGGGVCLLDAVDLYRIQTVNSCWIFYQSKLTCEWLLEFI